MGDIFSEGTVVVIVALLDREAFDSPKATFIIYMNGTQSKTKMISNLKKTHFRMTNKLKSIFKSQVNDIADSVRLC